MQPQLNNRTLKSAMNSRAEFETAIFNLLDNEFISDSTINTVSSAFCVSPRTFSRRLKEHGLSYRQLITRYRKAKAQRVLCESTLRISQISRQLGYADASNFIKAFRNWFGTTPREYRIAAQNTQAAPQVQTAPQVTSSLPAQ